MNQTSWLEEPAAAPPVPDGATDEWWTPDSVYLPLHEEFRFTLDPCASAESAKCKRYFTLEQNGLVHPWHGRVFMNPPYSSIAPWALKAFTEVEDGRAELVVALLPAWTDRAWWHDYVEPWRGRRRRCIRTEARFIKGRVPFGYPGCPTGSGQRGTFPSVIVIWSAGYNSRAS